MLLLLSGGAAGASQPSPPLPQLTLDAYPPAARDALAQAFRHAADRPDDARRVGGLGRLLHAWEQWEAAHQAYSRAQALAPAEFDWHYLDAVVLQRLARHSDAVARLHDAVRLAPASLPARLKLAESLLETGELDESGRLFDALASAPAAEPAARVGLGRVAASLGRHDEAVRHFRRAVELFPELGAAHYGLARSLRALGRTSDAEQALAAHAQYGPRWPRLDDPILDAVALERDDARREMQRGVALAEAGELEASVAAHEAALAREPQLAQAHANLISLYGRLKNWEAAEAHYRAALAGGLAGADVHYDYALVLTYQNDVDGAIDAYRKALAANPLHAPARNNLGQLRERSRDFAGAAAEYRQALDAQPSFRLARFNLGRMLLALGRPGEAAAEFERIVDLSDAETPRYLFGLATAYVQSGRTQDGRRTAERARSLALEHGQRELAAAIDRELAVLK